MFGAFSGCSKPSKTLFDIYGLLGNGFDTLNVFSCVRMRYTSRVAFTGTCRNPSFMHLSSMDADPRTYRRNMFDELPPFTTSDMVPKKLAM